LRTMWQIDTTHTIEIDEFAWITSTELKLHTSSVMRKQEGRREKASRADATLDRSRRAPHGN
jgi:hypothetical protein